MGEISRQEAETYLNMDESALFSLLVPETVRNQDVFTAEGLIARGRQIFTSKLKDAQQSVCTAYLSRKETVKGATELTILVAGALLSVSHLGVPIVPMAVLIVRIGLEELCRGASDATQQ